MKIDFSPNYYLRGLIFFISILWETQVSILDDGIYFVDWHHLVAGVDWLMRGIHDGVLCGSYLVVLLLYGVHLVVFSCSFTFIYIFLRSRKMLFFSPLLFWYKTDCGFYSVSIMKWNKRKTKKYSIIFLFFIFLKPRLNFIGLNHLSLFFIISKVYKICRKLKKKSER